MYFEIVDWATSKPSLSSSPWIRYLRKSFLGSLAPYYGG